ncbi:MAG: hypothetical protein KC462_01700 [Cyanobacteria bacterium HKST-UBA05]|nr:hypothetical protein [Cyanobacteria bacterium HKST-UBA05]
MSVVSSVVTPPLSLTARALAVVALAGLFFAGPTALALADSLTLADPLASLPSPQDPEMTDGVDLLMPGVFHGQEVEAKSGERWWGLFETQDNDTSGKKQYELRQVAIEVDVVHDPLVDTEPGQNSGKRVRVNEARQPIFLVQGDFFKPGPVNTVFEGVQFLYPGQQLAFSINEKPYFITSTGAVDSPSPQEGIHLRDYSLMLVDRTLAQEPDPHDGIPPHVQPLLSSNELDVFDGDRPSVYWVGDLDRDGLPDVLLDQSNDDDVNMMTLFMSHSSSATATQWLLPVGTFKAVGCPSKL